MAAVKTWRFYAHSKSGQIHVTAAEPGESRHGDRAPPKTPVVCFHQSPFSSAQFKVFQRVLAQDRRVLCFDTPGFGGSDAPASQPTISDYAAAMAGALEDIGYGGPGVGLGGNGPVDVIGSHTGGFIGAELAASRPDLVRRLVIASLAMFTDAQRAEISRRYGGPEPLVSDAGFLPKIFRASVLEGHAEMTDERRLEMFAERLRSNLRSWWGPQASMGYDPFRRLKALTQPVMLLALSDMLTENTRAGAALLPQAMLVDLSAEAGPAAWDAQPDLLAGRIREFFDAV